MTDTPPPSSADPPRRPRLSRVPARGPRPRRAAVPARGQGRRGRRGQPQGHDRPRGHPRLHARDDHALRRPREGRRPPAARGPRRRDHRHARGARLALLARGPRGREEGHPRPERDAGAAGPRAAPGRRDAGRRPRGPGRPAPAPRRPAREGGGPDLRLHPLPPAGLLPAPDEEVRRRAGAAHEGAGPRRPHAPPHDQLRPRARHAGRAARVREAVPEDDPALHALVARHREGRGDPGAGRGARARLRGGEPLLHPQPPHRRPRPRGEAPPALPRQRLDAGGARRRAESRGRG